MRTFSYCSTFLYGCSLKAACPPPAPPHTSIALPSPTLSRQAHPVLCTSCFDAVHFEGPMCVCTHAALSCAQTRRSADFCHRKRAAWLYPTKPPIFYVLTIMCYNHISYGPKEILKSSVSSFRLEGPRTNFAISWLPLKSLVAI
jgi:hypothetical protein